MSEQYPGQAYFHERNANIKRAETAPGVSHTVAELHGKLDAISESQGKLLAAIDSLRAAMHGEFAGLHDTAMRNHQQIRQCIEAISHPQCSVHITPGLLNKLWKYSPKPRKARKKVRRGRS